MTDYIISEDEMKNIIDLTEEMCETPGWVINVQPIANRRMDIINKVRSRPLSEVISSRHGCLTCFDSNCPVWQTADQNCWKPQEAHDTAIRKAEREGVLDKLKVWWQERQEDDTSYSCDDWVELQDKIESMRSES